MAQSEEELKSLDESEREEWKNWLLDAKSFLKELFQIAFENK